MSGPLLEIRGLTVRVGPYRNAPAIIEETFTTIVVYPGWKARVDDAGAPVLVTTDSVLYALHKSFDSILLAYEREALINEVDRMLMTMHGRLGEQIALGTSTHNTLIAGSLEMTGSGTGIIVRSPDGTRYRLGVATIFDVLQAQEQLTSAQVSEINARFSYLRAKTQIEALIGRRL